jgi:fibronectin-binding autotransporter adhesin
MKNNAFLAPFFKSIFCATIFAAIASTSAQAQAQIFWNEDNSTGTDLQSGTFSADEGGMFPTTFKDNIAEGDLVFSSDPVGDEAQTIYLAGNYKPGTGYVVNGLEFNHGSITIEDDPNHTGSQLLIGTDGITMDEGTGDASVSSPTLYVYGAQSWNNNSSASLTVGGAINTANSSEELTFAGTGAGSVNITGNIASGIYIDQESATSTLYLTNTNNSGITGVLINAGTVVATNLGSIGDGNNAFPIDINNGSALTFTNSFQMGAAVAISNGATLNFAGDTGLVWGNGNSNTVTAADGSALTLGSGDDLDDTRGSQNFQTLNLVGSGGTASTAYRLIVGIQGQGLGFLNGVSNINVGAGYTLDFGSSGTVDGTVDFASGSALEARNSVTVNLDDANLPVGGTLIFGNDDTGSSDAIHIATGQDLTGTTTIIENGSQALLFLDGNLTGNGGLTFTAQNAYYNFASPVVLTGTNNYSGPTILGARNGNNFPVVEINGNSSGIGNEIDVLSGHLILGTNAQLPTGSKISLGNPTSAQNSDYSVALQIGDGSAATSATVYDVVATSNWNNPNDAGQDQIIGTAAGATLTWDVEGAATTDDFGGHIGDGTSGGNNITIVKTGAGTLLLTGASAYTGGTVVDNGTLAFWGGNNFGADQSALGAAYNSSTNTYGPPTVTMNSGLGTLLNVNNNLYENVIFNTPGTVTINGDTISIAGRIAVIQDEAVSGNFTGGGGVAFTGGDALVGLASDPTAGNIYIEGGRVLLTNNNLVAGSGYSVTVGNGAVLDFGEGGTNGTTVPIVMENGSDLGDRGTNEVINDLVVPTTAASGTPTFTIGTDDEGGGSITVANNIQLTTNLQIDGAQFDGRSFTTANFAGGFSGTANLTFDTAALNVNTPITRNNGFIFVSGPNTYQGDTTVQGGILDLTGNNTGVTSAGGGAPNYYIVDTAKSYVDNSAVTHTVNTPGTLEIGAGGSLASNANVVVGGAAGFAFFVLGDGNGAVNQTVGNISVSQSGGGNDNGAIFGGASSISTLNVDVAANTTDVYTGIFGSSNGYNYGNTSDGGLNNYQNNLAVVFNIGSGGVMDLQGFNPGNVVLAGGFVANGGTLKVDGNAGALGNSNVTLNNTDLVIGNNQYGGSNTNPHVIIGTGTNQLNSEDGIDNFAGDIQSGAGSVIDVSGDNFIFTSDSTASTIGTLNIDGGRIFLMNSTGLNILANNAAVNVTNGAILDFATNTTSTIGNAISFASGTGLTLRDNGGPTNITLTNASLPTIGSFTVGSDDEGGQSGSYTITSGLALTGDLNLHVVGNSYIPVTLSGNITGNGGIYEDNGGNNGGNLYLTGTNSYSGETSAIFANLYIDGNNSAAGADYFSNFSTITIGTGGSIASDANLLFGNGGGYGVFVLGDANGAVDQTVAALTMESSGTSYVYNGDTKDSTNSILTVNNSSADTYTGILGNSGATNGNDLALVKNGAGTLTLTGANTYTGGTTVAGGKLAVNGSIAGNAVVNHGAELGGSGSIAGIISGAGAVGPGNSPGILTASQVDPSGGLSFNFELTQAGAPNYNNSSASGNDVLHLELASMPFVSPLTAANTVNVYLSGNGTFDGGFFATGSTNLVANTADGAAFTANLATADFIYYVLDPYGNVSYNGQNYALASSLGGIDLTSIIDVNSANFADGTVNGYEEQFELSGAAVPEPSTYALMGVAGLAFLFIRRLNT